MSAFTCINCGVRFATPELQREHYKSDWHRYNLKRRVAELPSVSAEEFQVRILQSKAAANDEKLNKESTLYCNACHKQFTNEKAHANHLNSKKHKENQLHFEQLHAGENVAITTKRLIEPKEHPALAAAAEGKGKFALEKVTEWEDLDDDNDNIDDDDNDVDDFEEVTVEDEEKLDELAENPLTERDCLFCTHQSEDLVENMKHMSIAHSFFLPDAEYCTDLEGLLDYLGEKVAVFFICLWCNDRGKTFYSLDAVRKHMVDKGHCQMLHEGIALAEYADYYDYSSSYPDHEEGMDVDEEVLPDLLDGDAYQLVLPSGAVIGHRSLLRYYKQRLNPNRALVPKKSDRKVHKLLSEYRALGWSKTQELAAKRKAQDIHMMKRLESKFAMRLGCKANKMQHHYRPQVLF